MVDMEVRTIDDGGDSEHSVIFLPKQLRNRLAEVAQKMEQPMSKIIEWSLVETIGAALGLVLVLTLPAIADDMPQLKLPPPPQAVLAPVKKPGLFHRAVDKVKGAGHAVATTARTTAHAVRHPKEAYHAAVKKPQT